MKDDEETIIPLAEMHKRGWVSPLDDGPSYTLKSGRVVYLLESGGVVNDCGLTPDERREIAAEMIARWMTWAEA